MTTLIFLCGIGIGTLVGTTFFFVMIGLVTKSIKRNSEEYNKVTTDLMRERNVTDGKIEKHLSVLAEWALRNWER